MKKLIVALKTYFYQLFLYCLEYQKKKMCKSIAKKLNTCLGLVRVSSKSGDSLIPNDHVTTKELNIRFK
jgi:hypothetical protein